MPRNKKEEKKTVLPGHSFFWKTRMTNERMKAISDWIVSLKGEERMMLSDLMNDIRQDEEYHNNEGC